LLLLNTGTIVQIENPVVVLATPTGSMSTKLKRDTQMKYNSTLADSASAGNNSASKIFVDDAWMLEESHAPKNKNFQKPTIWVSDITTTGKLATLFNVVELGDTSNFTPGEHYIIAERGTPEESIKACGWRLQAAGIKSKVYSVQTSLEYLLTEESTTIQETILHILEYAQPFEDWTLRIDDQPLTIKVAINVAREANRQVGASLSPSSRNQKKLLNLQPCDNAAKKHRTTGTN
jgi:hypothetical protein